MQYPFDLKGKLALVTGGASGIGSGIVTALAQAGAAIVIADRDGAGAQNQAASLVEAGHIAGAVQMDLAEEDSIVAGCAETIEKFGTPWILVNNAGLQDREALLEATTEEWDRMVDVNARGPFLMIREIARAMVEAGEGGRIVNISSTCVWAPMVIGLGAYSASKGALLALSRTAAFELVGHDITVNTVLPGGVMTPGSMNARGPIAEGPGHRTPPLGYCEPQDIAAAVVFFASPAARYVTNQSVAVDAGFSLT